VRTLTERELNRALLARQLLLERGRMSLPRALERIAGIQAQYAPSMYVGLWSRLEDFERDALTAALERRSVVQATLMRSTIHLVSKADYWPLALATRDARRESWQRAVPELPGPRTMAAAARKLRAALDGTMSRKEVDTLLGKDVARGVGLWIDLVRVPPSGTWERRRADLYAAAEDWLGAPPEIADPEEHLVRRYLAGFGPAALKDVASFTGLAPARLRPLLERMRLRRFRAADGEELLDLPRAPLPGPETPAPVRFLPTWDATLLVHARRTGVLPEQHRSRIFSSRNPHSFPTFLIDGCVAGTWRYEGGGVRLEPFGRLDAAARRELKREADRLAEFHA
jgi:Winged helix DNA-binding domain